MLAKANEWCQKMLDLACADRDAALELGKESRPDWSFCGVVELTASSRTAGDSDTQLQEKATIAV
jgi:hypothetical protein